jgi:hypothetical protein
MTHKSHETRIAWSMTPLPWRDSRARTLAVRGLWIVRVIRTVWKPVSATGGLGVMSAEAAPIQSFAFGACLSTANDGTVARSSPIMTAGTPRRSGQHQDTIFLSAFWGRWRLFITGSFEEFVAAPHGLSQIKTQSG